MKHGTARHGMWATASTAMQSLWNLRRRGQRKPIGSIHPGRCDCVPPPGWLAAAELSFCAQRSRAPLLSQQNRAKGTARPRPPAAKDRGRGQNTPCGLHRNCTLGRCRTGRAPVAGGEAAWTASRPTQRPWDRVCAPAPPPRQTPHRSCGSCSATNHTDGRFQNQG